MPGWIETPLTEKEFKAINAVHLALKDRVKPISAEDLSKISGVSERDIRNSVAWLRRHMVPVASGDDGYIIAKEWKDIEPTVCRLQAHALKELIIINALRKCFARDGQEDLFSMKGIR